MKINPSLPVLKTVVAAVFFISSFPAAADIFGTQAVTSAHAAQTFISGENAMFAGVGMTTSRTVDDKNLVQVAHSYGEFKTLLQAVDAAGLKAALEASGPFTLMAPSDAAFDKLDPGLLEALLKEENAAMLKSVLTYHVIPGRFSLREAFAEEKVTTLQGSELLFRIADGKLFVIDSPIITNDIPASNGVVHVIEEVLVPPDFQLVEMEVSSPTDLIILAIQRGTPLFNSGNARACSAIYEVAINALLGLAQDELPEQCFTDLSAALMRAEEETDPVMKAWILRHGLDDAYIGLDPNSKEDVSRNDLPLLIDDFSEPNTTSRLGTSWRLFTDRVMGGVSTATSRYEVVDGKPCLRMQGKVSLDNNGGFVQMALSLRPEDRPFDASGYRGVRVSIRGNGLPYYIHLRSAQNRLPWQYYSAPVTTEEKWKTIEIPFSAFEGQSTRVEMDPSILKRIAIVGAKKTFEADVAVSRIEFYR